MRADFKQNMVAIDFTFCFRVVIKIYTQKCKCLDFFDVFMM